MNSVELYSYNVRGAKVRFNFIVRMRDIFDEQGNWFMSFGMDIKHRLHFYQGEVEETILAIVEQPEEVKKILEMLIRDKGYEVTVDYRPTSEEAPGGIMTKTMMGTVEFKKLNDDEVKTCKRLLRNVNNHLGG